MNILLLFFMSATSNIRLANVGNYFKDKHDIKVVFNNHFFDTFFDLVF